MEKSENCDSDSWGEELISEIIGISSGNRTSIIDGLRPGEQIFIDIPPWANKRK